MNDYDFDMASLPPVVFLGGKGGVGKTTLAVATALVAAERGERCLLVSTDPAHSLSDLLETPFYDAVSEYRPGVFVRELDPDTARDRYLQQVKANIRDFTAPQFLAEAERQIDLAGAHPGAAESALFESLCQVVDGRDEWDRIIVDTAPTGHSLHLLGLPEAMSAWTESLLRRQSGRPVAQAPEGEARWQRLREVLDRRRGLFQRMRECLQSPADAAFVLVMNDDRLSIRESERAAEQLRALRVSIPLLVLNRVDHEADGSIMPPSLKGIPCRLLPRQTASPSGHDTVLELGRQLWRDGG